MQLKYDGYDDLEVRMLGGWLSQVSFERYVKADDITLQKKMGLLEIDDTWKQDLAPQAIRL